MLVVQYHVINIKVKPEAYSIYCEILLENSSDILLTQTFSGIQLIEQVFLLRFLITQRLRNTTISHRAVRYINLKFLFNNFVNGKTSKTIQ